MSDLLSRANRAMRKAKSLEVGNKFKEPNDDSEFETQVFTDRFGELKKLKLPKRQMKPEPNEILLEIKDDQNIFKKWKGCIEILIWNFESYFYEMDGNWWYTYDNEDCNLSLRPYDNWKLFIYSRNKSKYFDLFELFYNEFCNYFIKYIQEFNHYLWKNNKNQLWKYENHLYRLNFWNIKDLKIEFDLWNKTNNKGLYWYLLERIFKTLNKSPRENRNNEKINYFLKPFDFGFGAIADILTEKEKKQIGKSIDEVFEKYKNHFFDYQDFRKGSEKKFI